jgi:tritrans,polycis-undecaprenyl-diphosphate synthase [geranylgeranyl-diphosphate specific]
MENDPKHIAIILDGNRRFAKRLMMKPWMGHEWGKKKVESLINWCLELGMSELTLYAWSIENFNRPKEEFEYILKLFKEAFKDLEGNEKLQEREGAPGIRVKFLGRIGLFPNDVTKIMHSLMEKTSGNTGMTVNFCMAYGGRQEITDAAKKMISDAEAGRLSGKDINDETFKRYLYTPDEPDIIIRTGGEQRLSGFLLYQSSYSELFFVEKLWPEFEKQDLLKCIEEFRQRERRFGR